MTVLSKCIPLSPFLTGVNAQKDLLKPLRPSDLSDAHLREGVD